MAVQATPKSRGAVWFLIGYPKKPCLENSRLDNILRGILIYFNTAATQYLAAAFSLLSRSSGFVKEQDASKKNCCSGYSWRPIARRPFRASGIP